MSVTVALNTRVDLVSTRVLNMCDCECVRNPDPGNTIFVRPFFIVRPGASGNQLRLLNSEIA